MPHQEIGGFLELELAQRAEYHAGAIRLDKGRSALAYLLQAKPIRKVYLPYYACGSLLEPLDQLGVAYEFYRIDEQFRPQFDGTVGEQEAFLYINYFGVAGGVARQLAASADRLILDNTQAFFERPHPGADCLYSPRKFFGVPDGGYLYTDARLDEEPEPSQSYGQMEFLLKRIDCSAGQSYSLFQQNEEELAQQGMRGMSRLTQRLLSSIDYEAARGKREANFRYLHSRLSAHNELALDPAHLNGPMVYPLLLSRPGLREKLIANKVFVATYWREVLDITQPDWFEHRLARHLLPLPIDQRYGQAEMERILQFLDLN